jgi:uncharacterized protein (DUF3820 family)
MMADQPTAFQLRRAANHRLHFGKYRGQTIDNIAETDEGLLYLDWLIGQSWVHEMTRIALEVYLTQSSIVREIDRARRE